MVQEHGHKDQRVLPSVSGEDGRPGAFSCLEYLIAIINSLTYIAVELTLDSGLDPDATRLLPPASSSGHASSAIITNHMQDDNSLSLIDPHRCVLDMIA
jgi:hypothetical protein